MDEWGRTELGKSSGERGEEGNKGGNRETAKIKVHFSSRRFHIYEGDLNKNFKYQERQDPNWTSLDTKLTFQDHY